MVRGAKPNANTPAVVLLVMPSSERRSMLLAKLESVDAKFLVAENCRDARAVLRDQGDVNVIVTDTTLTDGNWCDVLNHVAHLGLRASVVVTSEIGDERLWSEVLWRGAYDLLLEPVEAREVQQVMEGALRASLPASRELANGRARSIQASRATNGYTAKSRTWLHSTAKSHFDHTP